MSRNYLDNSIETESLVSGKHAFLSSSQNPYIGLGLGSGVSNRELSNQKMGFGEGEGDRFHPPIEEESCNIEMIPHSLEPTKAQKKKYDEFCSYQALYKSKAHFSQIGNSSN